MDDNVIKATQASLGKIIKKPPLTDKLLNKPPFRFLHDVMTSVIKTSGFMKGLFTDTEMNSENVKDKDTKIAFLQKAIDIVSLVTGHTLVVKPTKVIAGHEPEQTNVFLQQLATAVKMKVNNADYVQRVLNGDTKDTKKSEKSIEKADKEKRDTSVDKHKDTEAEDSREPHKERDRSKDRSREGSRDDRHRDRDKDRHRGREKENRDGKDKSQERGKDIDENENVKKTKRETEEDKTGLAQKPVPSASDKKVEPSPPRGKSKTSDISTTGSSATSQASRVAAARKDSKTIARQQLKGRVARETGPGGPSTLHHPQQQGRNKQTPAAAVSATSKSQGKAQSQPSPAQPSASQVNSQQRRRISSTAPAGKLHGEESSNKPSRTSASASTSPSKHALDRPRKSSFTMMASQSPRDAGHSSDSPPECTASNNTGKDDRRLSQGHREHSGSRAQEQDQKMDQLQQNGEMDGHDQDTPAPRRIERPASAKGARRRRDGKQDSSDEEEVVAQQLQKEHEKPEALGEDNLPPQVSEARRLARPSSARPAPPRVKKQETASEEPAMRLGSGRPTNVIVDNAQSDDDDDDNFMVEESTPQITEPDRVAETKQDGDEEGEHGGLVKKILETKKELEGGSQTAPQTQKRTEIERPTMNDATKRREREVVQKEINKLRTSIQTLTRSANPLGKVMDYVQEDLDAMQKELDRWKQENREHTLALKREQAITDKAVEPLKAQLNDVEQAIKDQLDLIAAVKSNCITNDQKIDKMLRSICRT